MCCSALLRPLACQAVCSLFQRQPENGLNWARLGLIERLHDTCFYMVGRTCQSIGPLVGVAIRAYMIQYQKYRNYMNIYTRHFNIFTKNINKYQEAVATGPARPGVAGLGLFWILSRTVLILSLAF